MKFLLDKKFILIIKIFIYFKKKQNVPRGTFLRITKPVFVFNYKKIINL